MPDRLQDACLAAAFWVPLALCSWLALTPSPPDAISRISDVILHGLAFVYLTLALILAHYPESRWVPGLWMLGYGVVLELLQSLVPERTPEFKDFWVDGIGVAIGLWVGSAFEQRIRAGVRWVLGRLWPST